MSHESDADRTVSVEDDEVRVEKSFEGDEFPVPAIKFRVTSDSDAPVHIRLIDQIPEDFPMESVGFHPDFESDNWTAYKDHRVEYERTLEPGEETVTVYGIRLDQSTEVSGFLGDPILERPPAPGEEGSEEGARNVEDILGADRSQLVRDALQGNGRLAAQEADPDAETAEPLGEAPPSADDGAAVAEATAGDGVVADEEAAAVPSDDDAGPEDATAAGPTATPRTVDAGLTPAIQEGSDEGDESGADSDESEAVEPEAESAADVDAIEDESDVDAVEDDSDADAVDAETEGDEPEGDASDEPEEATSGGSAADDYVDVGAHVDGDAETVSAESDAVGDGRAAGDAAAGGLAATLAAEIRAGDVAEDDLDVLREELDVGLPRSADVRIRRVQAQMEDLNAYADAIAEFIDEEGTGAELVERLDTELTEINDELEGLRSEVDDAATDREGLRGDLGEVDEAVDAIETRLDDVAEDAETAVSGVGELHERAEGLESQIEATTDRVGSVESEVETVGDDVGDLVADVDDVAASVDGVNEDVDEVGAHVTRLDEEMGDVREDIAAIDGDIVDVQESLEAEIDELRADVSALSADLDRIDAIEAEIEELQTFRDRLNSAFGSPGEE